MIKTFIPRVAVVNDLSGFGRVSLTEACPILSAMGVEACPLPTSVLSTHTYRFCDYTFLDLTDEMEKILNHWKALDIEFTALCTGYMASARQIEIMSDFAREKKKEGTIMVIDPVLGDNQLSDVETVYYDRMQDLLVAMRNYVSLADVITPNLTEACLLLDKPYPKHYLTPEEIKELCLELSNLGPKCVAITSVMTDRSHMYVAVYDADADYFSLEDCGYIDRPFHGTGDIFAAMLTGALAKGKAMKDASRIGVEFVSRAIAETMKYPDMKIEYGVVFEPILADFFKNFN